MTRRPGVFNAAKPVSDSALETTQEQQPLEFERNELTGEDRLTTSGT